MLNKLGMGQPSEFSFQEITFIFVQCKANLAQRSFSLKSKNNKIKFKKILALPLTLAILIGYKKKSAGSRENLSLRS